MTVMKFLNKIQYKIYHRNQISLYYSVYANLDLLFNSKTVSENVL